MPGFVDIRSWFRPAPLYSFGAATFYAPYVMEGTARWRGFSLDGYLDGVSLMSPADIGATVWLRRPGGDWEGPYLVVDCAANNDIYSTITHRNEIVEVGFSTAVRWGMIVHGETGWYTKHWTLSGVEVIKSVALPEWAKPGAVPADQMPRPMDFVSWWRAQVTFATGPEPRPYYVRPGGWDMRDGGPVLRWYNFDIAQPADRVHNGVRIQVEASLR